MGKRIFILLFSCLLSACSSHSSLPQHAGNVCYLFSHKPSWLWAAEEAGKRWGVSISLLMAIIFQESHFKEGAAPARQKLFNSIPWFRPTTAEGYPQATNETWYVYCKNRDRISADRDLFEDAVDFIGWYISYAHLKLHIQKTDAYRIYLAYHEGIRGYELKSFRNKSWLIEVAHRVETQTATYERQLVQCRGGLPLKPRWTN